MQERLHSAEQEAVGEIDAAQTRDDLETGLG